MIDPNSIRKDMRVIGSDGSELGLVDDIETTQIKLRKVDSPDGHHHYVAMSQVARVDDHVHLNVGRDAIYGAGHLHDHNTTGLGTGAAAGVAGVGAAGLGATHAHASDRVHHDNVTRATTTHTPHYDTHEEPKRSILPWLLLGLGLLGLLAWLFTRPTTTEVRNDVAAAPVAVVPAGETVTLPNGRTLTVAPNTITYDLNRFLVGTEAAPKTFTFDKLNFATGSAEIRAEDRPTVEAIADIMAAYPNVKGKVVGFTDATGDPVANKKLSADRAAAVVAAIVAKGIDKGRLSSEAGGVAPDASGGKQLDARRTDLVITAR